MFSRVNAHTFFFQNSPHLDKESLVFCGERVVWHRPTSLEELLALKSKYPQAKLVNGNTEVGMYECCNVN